jgi:uncharacterized protein YjbJ (UPF0337 family)
MGKLSKAKELLGNVTEDREVEAKGRAERLADDPHPSEDFVGVVQEEVREERGETKGRPVAD